MDEKYPAPSNVLTEFSLKTGESIVLKFPNGSGYVTVVDICEARDRSELKTRLGFVIPKEFPVHRKEVLDMLQGRGSEG